MMVTVKIMDGKSLSKTTKIIQSYLDFARQPKEYSIYLESQNIFFIYKLIFFSRRFWQCTLCPSSIT